MLVLSRKVGEKLVIGDNITVIINRVAGNRVTIGVEAPPDVRIVRGELKPAASIRPGAELSANAIADPLGPEVGAAAVYVPQLTK